MSLLLTVLLQTYFIVFPSQTKEALNFFQDNAALINKQLSDLPEEEKKMALAIVAPEVSQYSSVVNFLEMRSLFIMYRSYGKGDFSVGHFSMKPSFVEALEKEISEGGYLPEKYKSYIPEGEPKEQRTTRLKRLGDEKWQLRYLKVFIDVVKEKTKDINFPNLESKLKYWATLYNAGFDSSPEKVKSCQQKKQFPHNSKQFNYSDIVVEFFEAM